MAALVGPGDGAEDLRHRASVSERGHRPAFVIRSLLLQPSPVDRSTVETRRGAGLQAGHRELGCTQLLSQLVRTRLADAATLQPFFAAKQRPAKERAGAQDDSLPCKFGTVCEANTGHPGPIHQQLCDFPFDAGEISLFGKHALDRRLEQFSVRLDARPPYGAALRPVEHAIMDRSLVGRARDQSVKGVHLAHEVALAQTSDGRIAAHRPDGIEIERHQCRAQAHARNDRSRLHAGVPTAYNDDIE